MTASITTLIDARVNSADFTLPVFSQVALDIQNAINTNAELSQIEAMILKDQSLAAEILRLANSAVFAGLSTQKSVQQALIRLGVKRVYSMVMMAAQQQSFQARDPHLDALMKTLWQHAAAGASACRWVALKCKQQSLAEDAFLAGLLHDLGSMMVLKACDELMAQDQNTQLDAEAVAEVIDALHTEYGYRIMQNWNLPPLYAEIARDHHSSQNDSGSVLLQIVRLVDAVCAKVGIGMNYDPDIDLNDLPEVKQLGISNEQLEDLVVELENIVDTL